MVGLEVAMGEASVVASNVIEEDWLDAVTPIVEYG